MGQNVIELNGKKYDALSGALLGESRIKAIPATPAAQKHRGRVIDGFMGKKHPSRTPHVIIPSAAKPTTPQAPAATKKPGNNSSKHFDIQRKPANLKPHQTERPKTLMRHVVSKPKVTMKPAMKTAAPSEMMARPKSTIAKPLEKKLSVSQVNPIRLARSRHVAKSHHIRRFEPEATRQRVSTTAAQAAPAYIPRQPSTPAISQTASRQNVNPAIRAQGNQTQLKNQFANDIFEAALAHANSHEQQTPSHAKYRTAKRRRWVNVMAGVGTFLLIGGFVAYSNMNNIELRVASMRAGFHAQMPGYQPDGYALAGGIESSEGKVAINFRSGDSLYTVTQEASDWNSSTLLDQTSAEQGRPIQTIQSKGRTVYIYNDSNATWVNGGVRYQVTGNAPLDADELVSLATSM